MRKNILILGHDYKTPFLDVVNQYTYLFDREKFSITAAYLTGEFDEKIKEQTLADDVIFFEIPKKKIRSLKIGAIKKLLALTREKKFEIVICHRYKPSFIMMWVAQFCKIPVLVSVMHEFRTMSSINRKILVAALARKNMIFAGVSNAVRDDVRKSLWFIPNERIVTLYNTIDAESTEPQLLSRQIARKSLNLSDDDFIFGNLGRLAVNKDQQTLIHAFARVKPHCPKAKLIIIGAGELRPELQKLVNLYELNNDVLFTGFLDQGFRYLKAFDCFVLSSIQEAFGRVLLEAMVAKLPLIATRVHGIPEVVGDTGILLEPKDVDGFAAAMQKIYDLSEQERELLGDKAYTRVVQDFSMRNFREQFWQLPLVSKQGTPI